MYPPNVSHLHKNGGGTFVANRSATLNGNGSGSFVANRTATLNGRGGTFVASRSASSNGTVLGSRPPIPTTKPPLRQASLIPTKMQNLDQNVVNKFLQAVNQESPSSQRNGGSGGAHNSDKPFKSEYSFQPQAQPPQSSHLWKQPERSVHEGVEPVQLRRGSENSGLTKTPWLNKTTEKDDVKSPAPSWGKPSDAPKPTWNAKTLEKPKAVWTPKSDNSNFKECNGEDAVKVSTAQPSWCSNNGVDQKNKVVLRHDSAAKQYSGNRAAQGVQLRSNGVASQLSPGGVNNRVSAVGADWRSRFEESEKKRKELLEENQRAALEKAALLRKSARLETDLRLLQTDHQEKCQQLDKLSQVSQKVYQDYDTLNNKYEVETTAMHRALQVASKWYLQNKKLRRESVARAAHEPSPLDETDGDDTELEDLRKTVQDLSTQVGQLQSDLNSAKLQEFEAQEQQVNGQQQLEDERLKVQQLSKEVKELQIMRDKFESVTVMVRGEMESLRNQRDNAMEQVKRLQEVSFEAKRERNVLQHQSTLLMGDITSDEKLFKVLLEVEDLKRKLEEAEHKHAMEMQEMQERLDEKQADSYVEMLEGKLGVVESELQMALERAEQAELALQGAIAREKAKPESAGPPCPPPPPPPPPMPPMLGGFNPPLKKTTSHHRPTEGDSLEDMARLLGIERTPKPPSPQGLAIDNIINEIKGGKFTLKATEKTAPAKKEEPPAAVQEMLSIIGTLKRRPKNQTAINV